MTDVASLAIKVDSIEAEIAALRLAKLKSAGDDAGAMADFIATKFSGLAKVLGPAALAGAFILAVKHALDLQAQYARLAEVAGTTASRLSSLDLPARLAGVSLDAVATSIARLGKSIGEARLGDVQKGGLLGALGIDVKDGRDAGEVFVDLARTLLSMKDQTIASAISMQLLGRGFSEMRPLMKEIIEQGELQARVTDEQAKAAKRFEDSWIKLMFQLQQSKITVGNATLPVMQSFLDKLNQIIARGEYWRLINVGGMLTTSIIRPEEAALKKVGSQADVRRSDIAMGLGGPVGPSAEDEAKKYLEDRKNYEARIQALKGFAALFAEETKTGNALIDEAFKQGGIDNLRTQIDLLNQHRELNNANLEEQRRSLQLQLKENLKQGEKGKAEETLSAIKIVNSQIVANQVITDAKITSLKVVTYQKQLADYNAFVDAQLALGASLVDTQRQVEERSYAERKQAIDLFIQNNQDREAEGIAARERLAQQHAHSMVAIAQEEWRGRVALAGLTNRDLISINENLFGVLAGLMNTGSRRLFEIGKAASIANAIIKTYEAANNAFEVGTEISVFAGYAFMAAAIIAGLANVQKIAQTQFGSTSAGGGGASFAPGVGTGGTPVIDVGSQRPAPPSAPSVTVIVQGNFIGTQQFMDDYILPAIRDAADNREFLLFDPVNSQQAQRLVPVT